MRKREEKFAGRRDPIRTDHCPGCGKELKPLPGLARGDRTDPFCSTACCKRWYDVKEYGYGLHSV